MTKTANKMDDLLDEDDNLKLPPEEDVKIDKTIPFIASNKNQAPPGTIKVPDFRGKKARETEKLYTSAGISRKYIPPLTRKRAAIYQLIDVKGKKDNRLQGIDAFVEPQPYELVPSYTFTDGDEPDLTKREKTMTYYEGGTEIVYVLDMVTKKNIPTSVPKVGAPRFLQGQIVINIYSEYQRYLWWELHPRNATNKWRNKAVSPIFERVDTQYKSPHVQNIRMNLQLDAERYIIGLKPDELIQLGAALTNPTINTNINPQELRLEMRTRARNNPEEILYTAHDKKASIKVAVIHALDLGILTYVPEHEAYYYGQSEDPMFRVPINNDPFESLCSMLVEPKSEPQYNAIAEDLAFWF